MKTLILSVDRDDDLGRKTGIPGPVLGRDAVLEAANRLALADPEDSDANTLFASVATRDEIAQDAAPGRIYDVAAITGHKQVGPKSDAILVDQFERVLEAVKPDRLILVSDGAEDESILPLLESRIKIDHVRRVVIKQSKNLEGAYYLFVRLFEDERLQKRFILPASIAIIVFGIAFAIGRVALAFGLALFTLGTLLLIHAMHWEARIVRVSRDLYASLKTGKVSFFTTVLAFALISFGALRAWSDLHAGPAAGDALLFGILFLNVALWWMVAGLILNIVGRALDELVRFQSTKGIYWRLSFGLVALGFILEGLTIAAADWRLGSALLDVLLDRAVYGKVLLGLFIAALGNVTYRYVSDSMREDEEEHRSAPRGERISLRRPTPLDTKKERRASTAQHREG